MSKTIVVKYRTEKSHCQCCDQKLPKPKISEDKEFEFSIERTKQWVDWKEIAEFDEDLGDIVNDYVYQTISFFATSSYDGLIIESSEYDKVKKFILEEIVA
ncbi:hypothetical protein QTG56_24105 (plasmid) [Rossellomorea sp. AcN35-11]|nr:hypothetical protein [Rossellomorea aquimaris]WJV31723.1 hypothetical protein QTG56_24105 [Rossellomorea sp. AcN35-11]